MSYQPKIALVHDYLNEYGGAERVLEAFCEIFPKAPIYTAFVNKNSPAYKRFKGKKIITSWVQNIPFFTTRLYSPLRFLAPLIWGSFASQLADFDVVLASSSWFVTKGFIKRVKESPLRRSFVGQAKSQRVNWSRPIEICYCHTPPRYLYGYKTSVDWQKYWPVRVYALVVNHFMRVYDFESAQRVDHFIANSHEVAARIKKFYRRESTVIYPPVDVRRFARKTLKAKRLKQKKEAFSVERSALSKYFLVVSRLVASKNVDVVVEVCAKLDLPLKVVGTGRELEVLKKLAEKLTVNRQPSTIKFIGDVSDGELVKLYQNCRAVIFAASQEDFGLVPVEAMAAGKPVIVNAEGGVLESVIDAIPAGKGKGTGVYFDPPTTGSLTLAINNFADLEKKHYFDSDFIHAHAQKFSKEHFKREILKFIKNKLK